MTSKTPQEKVTACVTAIGRNLQTILKTFETSGASFTKAQRANIFSHLAASMVLVRTKAEAAHDVSSITVFDIDAVLEQAHETRQPLTVLTGTDQHEGPSMTLMVPAQPKALRDGVAYSADGKPAGRMMKGDDGKPRPGTIIDTKPKVETFKTKEAGFMGAGDSDEGDGDAETDEMMEVED